MNKKGFTLVELIVVVTILGILATIGFVAYSGYLVGVRDGNRLAAITAISDGLELYRTRNRLPIPDKNIEIRANGTLIGWQGDAGANVLQTIEYSKGGRDPKDDTFFAYYLSRDKKIYQILTHLERDPLAELEQVALPQKTHALDYENRYIYVSGRNLGIFTGRGDYLYVPVHRIPTLVESGSIDIVTTPDTYTAHLDNDTQITGNGTILSAVSTNSSCQRLYELGNKENGVYEVNPTGTSLYEVYCNMTLAGGGWTLIATTADDGNNTWTYDTRANLSNNSIIGNVQDRKLDYKSQAYSELIFKDMLFLDKQGVWGGYDEINVNYNQTMNNWVPTTLACAFGAGRDHDLTSGNVRKNVGIDDYHQDRKLFFTVYDYQNGVCPDSGQHAIGPTWGYRNNGGVSPDDPGGMGWGLNNSGNSSEQAKEAGDARLGMKTYTTDETNDGDYIMWFAR